MEIRGLFGDLKRKIVGKKIRIVLPEGTDGRVVRAAARLKFEGLMEPIIIGNPTEVHNLLIEFGFSDPGITVLDPNNYANFETMKSEFLALRKGKVDESQADEILCDVNYFGVMLVQMGLAEGMVSGAIHSTADTVRPALQIIKTKPGVKRTSGVFLMMKEEKQYIFGDCAINIDPDAEALADIAINSAETAKTFGIDPKVAMISYSTKGSGSGPQVDKVVEATRIVQELRPDLLIDGELQMDAALVSGTAKLKAPNSPVAGQANVFIFPAIEAGNIAYKIAERLGGYDAVGPVLQGLNKPVNDLSRGCSSEDVYKLSIITAAQAVDEL
ncbi:phosphate acetyltransferase [Streptococcus sp. X16XC17]|uniref:phosphate acetyltransferase n=1 Tax=unclassified Streptococcus TaxID=2608887 RepID=UPI00066FDB74|nr:MULTISPECIES: phosphate acetyltransferase [unclassified Streptococcus]TCD46396.1 phosphate acetyltransferase [Streptococcus sp. X16XC17]